MGWNYSGAGGVRSRHHLQHPTAGPHHHQPLGFTQFQQGKNFYYFPDQLSIDRYRDRDGNLHDYVVAARELNPDHLIDNQRDWINRHTVFTHGNGFIASPANTVRGIANDPNQNGGYPDFWPASSGPTAA